MRLLYYIPSACKALSQGFQAASSPPRALRAYLPLAPFTSAFRPSTFLFPVKQQPTVGPCYRLSSHHGALYPWATL